MCKYVYGNDKWVIKLGDINKDLLGKTIELLDSREKVSQALSIRNKEILKFLQS